MKRKKWTALMIAACMAALSITGCGAKQTDQTGGEVSTGQETAEAVSTEDSKDMFNESGQLPILKEKEKITIGIAQLSQVIDYDTNALTKNIEEDVNVDIEFVFFPETDAQGKFSIMANSGTEMPDIIMGYDLIQQNASVYGASGLFLPLNEYYEDPDISYYFHHEIPEEDQELMLKGVTSADGNIYAMASYYPALANEISQRYWINQTWLDKLGLDMPTTTEEFYEVLKAFKTQDPNGNGKADEIPLIGSKDGWNQRPQDFLMNAFVYANNDQKYLMVKDGKVMASYTQPEWRDGLEYMNMLCTEGLLDPMSYTQDVKQLKALLENEEVQLVGCLAAGSMSAYLPESERRVDMEPLPPLTGPEGVRYAAYSPTTIIEEMAITKYCKNPELAFRLGDYLYEESMSMMTRYGVEGVDWTREGADKEKGLYEDSLGIPCGFLILNDIWNVDQNSSWRQVGPAYRSGSMSDQGVAANPDPKATVSMLSKAVGLYKDYTPTEYVNNLVYTVDEKEERAELYTTIKAARDEAIVRFITGDRPLSEWDDYLKELEACGLERYLEIEQSAYDRAEGRK